MGRVILEVPEITYRALLEHLLPMRCRNEQAAFMYTKVDSCNGDVFLRFLDWEAMSTEDLLSGSEYYLELADTARARIIKRAHDLKASIVEWHSHPWHCRAAFSMTDLSGFREFVPHVWWRTKGRPYAAVVVALNDFDALAWTEDPRRPRRVDALHVGSSVFFPTGLTIGQGRRCHAWQV